MRAPAALSPPLTLRRMQFVGRMSGLIQRYSLPMVTWEDAFVIEMTPVQLEVNMDTTRCAAHSPAWLARVSGRPCVTITAHRIRLQASRA